MSSRASIGGQIYRIASREVGVGLRSKQFYVSMAVSLIFVVLLVALPKLIGGMSSERAVAVVGSSEERKLFLTLLPAQAGVAYQGMESAPAPDARFDVIVDLGAEPVVLNARTSSIAAEFGQLLPVLQLYQERALLIQSGTAFVPPAPPTLSYQEDDSDRGARLVLAYVISLILFLQISGLASSVAQGTLEEKSNRVIDVLYPKVSALRILIGKVIGIGVFGLMQMVLLGAVGVAAVFLIGQVELRAAIVPSVLTSLLWFLMGYLFMAFLSGAVASTVRRSDALPLVMMPLQLLNSVVFITAVLALQNISAAWVNWLSLFPPFSAILAPMRAAAGLLEPGQAAIGLMASALGILLCAVIGGKVYQRSIVGKEMVG